MPSNENETNAQNNENLMNNVRLIEKNCDKDILPGYCKPDTSFFQFECLEGYILDEGYLKVKCLFSYLWDTLPVCVKLANSKKKN